MLSGSPTGMPILVTGIMPAAGPAPTGPTAPPPASEPNDGIGLTAATLGSATQHGRYGYAVSPLSSADTVLNESLPLGLALQ